MASLIRFFRCIGRAVVRNGGRALASLLPLGDAAYEIARDAYDEYRKEHGEEQLRTELTTLAQANREEVRHAASAAAGAEAESQPPEIRLALVSYLEQLPAPVEPPAVVIPSPTQSYTLRGILTAGDVADVHLGNVAEANYLLKISRIREGELLLDRERRVLNALRSAGAGSTYAEYLPRLVESFTVCDAFTKRVNVFEHELGLYTLAQVHDQYPLLDGRHLAWIFKRLLTVLGFCHRQGVVHGAVLPGHVLLHAANHGLRLVGWGQCGEIGTTLRQVPGQFVDWYPPEVRNRQPIGPQTDLFLAARCMEYLAGDRSEEARVPRALRRFFSGCLLPGMKMRPDDAWALQDELDEVLGRLYGPPKFHPLNMS